MNSVHSSGPARSERFFRAWTVVVLRFRWLLLAMTLAGTAWASSQLPSLTIDNSIEVFMDSSSERAAVMKELRDAFGHDEYVFVLVEGDVFTTDYLKRLRNLHRALAAIDLPLSSLGTRMSDRAAQRAGDELPQGGEGSMNSPVSDGLAHGAFAGFVDSDGEGASGGDGWGEETGGSVVERVTSLYNARMIERQGSSLQVHGLLESWPSASDMPVLRRRVLSNQALVGRLINPKASHSVILVQTGFMSEPDRAQVFEEITRISVSNDAEGFRILPGGLPAIDATLNALMHKDLEVLIAAALAAIALVLLAIFRHPLGILGPMLVVVQATLWTLGTVAAVGVPFTVIMNILPSFLICVGVADAVHIQSVYRQMRRQGVPNEQAIADAIATTGLAIVYTTVTTCVGLLSFGVSGLDTIRDTGLFGALGVATALLHSVVFLPILLSFNSKSLLGERAGERPRPRLEGFLTWCDGLSKDTHGAHIRRRVTLALASLFTFAALQAGSLVTVHQDFLSWLPEGQMTRRAFDALDEHMGGAADVSLLIDPRQGRDLRDRELLLALQKLEQHMLEYRDPHTGEALIGNVISILDPVRESHLLLSGQEGLPESSRGTVDMFTVLENASPQYMSELVTVDMQRSVMTARMRWLDAFAYGPFMTHLERGIAAYVGDLADVRPTGSAVNTFQISSSLTMDLMRSFGIALLVITIMMVIVLGDLRLGMIAMVPNLLPIVSALGFMGLTDIPVDIGTLLVASVAIGLAVDDTIHFVYQFKANYRSHGNVNDALHWAFEHSGRAMVSTSITLVIGDLVLLLASVIMLQRFGLLCALTVVMALLSDLILAPALLRTFYRDRPHGVAAGR